MLYEYECTECEHRFEKVKHHSKYKEDDECPKCQSVAKKIVSLFNAPVMERAEFNHAFGQVVKSKKHRKELAKRHGMIEVGTEKTENIHKETKKTHDKIMSWDGVI